MHSVNELMLLIALYCPKLIELKLVAKLSFLLTPIATLLSSCPKITKLEIFAFYQIKVLYSKLPNVGTSSMVVDNINHMENGGQTLALELSDLQSFFQALPLNIDYLSFYDFKRSDFPLEVFAFLANKKLPLKQLNLMGKFVEIAHIITYFVCFYQCVTQKVVLVADNIYRQEF